MPLAEVVSLELEGNDPQECLLHDGAGLPRLVGPVPPYIEPVMHVLPCTLVGNRRDVLDLLVQIEHVCRLLVHLL